MAISFICPKCRALLKVRDESFVGTTLDCPDCHSPLLVAINAAGEIFAQEIPADKPALKATTKPEAAGRKQSAAKKKLSEDASFTPLAMTASGSKTPQIVAWVVAGICLLALIPFLMPARQSDPSVTETPAKPAKKAAEDSDKATEVAKVEKPAVAQPEVRPLPDSPQGRLEELGRLVLDQARAEQQFPAGTVPAPGVGANQRWSWLAQLAAKRDALKGSSADWNQAWNDPSQDRFVRRPIARLQNPAVPTIVSEDKYPATHFVGVAGVGADAPTLPAEHGRAGIFGQDRQTKLDQIRDGVSNTMLLAGVEEHLGSWAAGTTSYRAFTQEPYVRGPDGFGTGQPDSMFVLMADGSVREISKKIDPSLVRRMAAMNDGFPLDADIPGEPGEPRPGTVPIPDPLTAEVRPPDKADAGSDVVKPVKPIEAPPEPIDIPAALSRKVLKFEQSKPAAAFQLLLQIEELAGVRIEYDREKLGSAADRLDKQITLKKENASLEELLDDVLKQIDLARQSEPTCIRIVTTEST